MKACHDEVYGKVIQASKKRSQKDVIWADCPEVPPPRCYLTAIRALRWQGPWRCEEESNKASSFSSSSSSSPFSPKGDSQPSTRAIWSLSEEKIFSSCQDSHKGEEVIQRSFATTTSWAEASFRDDFHLQCSSSVRTSAFWPFMDSVRYPAAAAMETRKITDKA